MDTLLGDPADPGHRIVDAPAQLAEALCDIGDHGTHDRQDGQDDEHEPGREVCHVGEQEDDLRAVLDQGQQGAGNGLGYLLNRVG